MDVQLYLIKKQTVQKASYLLFTPCYLYSEMFLHPLGYHLPYLPIYFSMYAPHMRMGQSGEAPCSNFCHPPI